MHDGWFDAPAKHAGLSLNQLRTMPVRSPDPTAVHSRPHTHACAAVRCVCRVVRCAGKFGRAGSDRGGRTPRRATAEHSPPDAAPLLQVPDARDQSSCHRSPGTVLPSPSHDSSPHARPHTRTIARTHNATCVRSNVRARASQGRQRAWRRVQRGSAGDPRRAHTKCKEKAPVQRRPPRKHQIRRITPSRHSIVRLPLRSRPRIVCHVRVVRVACCMCVSCVSCFCKWLMAACACVMVAAQ
jgi:hypothetical protein